MAEVRETAFELERFSWTEPDRLEVTGRWTGLEGRRLGRPVLTLTIGGEQRRLTALPGGHLRGSGEWRATFTFDGDPTTVTEAELEVGRRLVVSLPPPRKRRPRPDDGALKEERARREAAEATIAERDAEIVGLRDEAETVIGEREAEIETLRGQLAAIEAAQAELQQQVEQMRADLANRDEELATVQAELQEARDAAEQRLAAERAATTEVREKLATAREEAEATMETESQETERLRAELRTAREETERLVEAERAETARLREELAAASSAHKNGGDDGGEAEVAARRMYERIARELENERAAARSLRRELDAVQAQTAEHRRITSTAAANGLSTSEDAPVAATPAGRLAAARRSEVGRAVAHQRAEAARAAAAQRVPEHRSAAAVWVVRGIAVAFVAGLLIVLLLIVSALT
jgi:hypothetical protein